MKRCRGQVLFLCGNKVSSLFPCVILIEGFFLHEGVLSAFKDARLFFSLCSKEKPDNIQVPLLLADVFMYKIK